MTRRTTVTLDQRDEHTIRTFNDPAHPEWAVLVQAAAAMGITIKPGASEATIIRALLHAGAQALRDRALEFGYQELAAAWGEVHDHDEARERRRRYAKRVDKAMQA